MSEDLILDEIINETKVEIDEDVKNFGKNCFFAGFKLAIEYNKRVNNKLVNSEQIEYFSEYFIEKIKGLAEKEPSESEN